MIRLRVERAGRQPPALAPGAPGVVTWNDPDGAVFAHSLLRGDDHRIEIPGVGQFAFSSRGTDVVVWPRDGVREEILAEYYYRSVLPLALQARGAQVLHASAVERGGAVLGLAGAKENGKSTLAFALGGRGWAPFADDALVFESSGDAIEALAVPFDLRLRRSPAELFGCSRIVPVSRPRHGEGEPFAARRSKLAAVVVLERREGAAAPAEPVLDRLAGSEALLAVLAHAYCFEFTSPEPRRRIFDQYLAMVARVSVYRLRYPSGLELLPRLVGLIEAALAEPAAPDPSDPHR